MWCLLLVSGAVVSGAVLFSVMVFSDMPSIDNGSSHSSLAVPLRCKHGLMPPPGGV